MKEFSMVTGIKQGKLTAHAHFVNSQWVTTAKRGGHMVRKRAIALTIIMPFLFTVYASAQTQTWKIMEQSNQAFRSDPRWLGADGASSIELGDGRILWLFSDTFIDTSGNGQRQNSVMIRNSVAIQSGHEITKDQLKFYYGQSGRKPESFFKSKNDRWFWTGHGTLIKDKLVIFLMEMEKSDSGLGFRHSGWQVAVINNPREAPSEWHIRYIQSPNTFGTIAGSAQVLQDNNYIYALGADESNGHQVYPIRWPVHQVYAEDFSNPEWYSQHKWVSRFPGKNVLTPIFSAQTEYSIHYDSSQNKFTQIQSYGFGKATIGVRHSNALTGPWTEPKILFTPGYSNYKNPIMYAARAHPEQRSGGIIITYNINSLDFSELIRDTSLYYPRIILLNYLSK